MCTQGEPDATILARDAWRAASRALGVVVITPAEALAGDLRCVFLMILPQFGGPRGMAAGAIWPPEYRSDPIEALVAARSGLYYSRINVESYSSFEAARFIDALADWGYFGPESHRPHWLTNDGLG